MKTYTKTTPYARKRTVFFALLAVLFILFGTYIYFVSASIVHVIVRKEVDQNMAQVSSQISDLESRYIEAKHAIDEERIAALGFVESPERVYIQKAPTNLVLVSQNEI